MNYIQNGYHLENGFFSGTDIRHVFHDIWEVFALYAKKVKSLNELCYGLFESDLEGFIGCCNAAQNLPSLQRLFVSDNMVKMLQKLGMKRPNINTRPLLHFSSQRCASQEHYWKVPPHQDWPSNQGSLNGITCWMPLVDVTQNMGPLQIIPGSHKHGSVEHELETVPVIKKQLTGWIELPMKEGDAVFFSTFAVHQSGHNSSDRIRLSAACRFNDLSEPSFMERKYPAPPKTRQVRNDFPTEEDLKRYGA